MSSHSADGASYVHRGFEMSFSPKNHQFNFYTATSSEYNAAKRCSDIVNGYAVAYPADQLYNSWIAIKLADGDSDGVLYDNRKAAVRHQSDEKVCAYLSLRSAPGGMTVKDAFLFIAYHRAAYDAGYRLPDPDDMNGGQELVMPIERAAVDGQLARLLQAAGKSPHFRI